MMSDKQHLFLQFFCQWTSKVITNLQCWYSLDESSSELRSSESVTTILAHKPPPSLPPCPSWSPVCAVYHNFRLQLSHFSSTQKPFNTVFYFSKVHECTLKIVQNFMLIAKPSALNLSHCTRPLTTWFIYQSLKMKNVLVLGGHSQDAWGYEFSIVWYQLFHDGVREICTCAALFWTLPAGLFVCL